MKAAQSLSKLISLAQAGDADAYTQLFSRLTAILAKFCEMATAEDAAQAVLCELLVTDKSLNAKHTPEWLLGRAIESLETDDFARHTVPLEGTSAYRKYVEAALTTFQTPEHVVLAHEATSRLNKLDEPEREAVTLCCMYGLTAEEAAESLGISVATVQKRNELGLLHLRSAMSIQHNAHA